MSTEFDYSPPHFNYYIRPKGQSYAVWTRRGMIDEDCRTMLKFLTEWCKIEGMGNLEPGEYTVEVHLPDGAVYKDSLSIDRTRTQKWMDREFEKLRREHEVK